MDVKALVERQFSRAARRYASSPVHGGPDVARMLEAARLGGGERVLDLGCGPGHTALAFAERAREVVGLDLSESMLELARAAAQRRGLHNARFERGDAECLPFGDGTFDVVTSRYSAHHYPRPLGALREAARVLRPGGTFVLLDAVSPEDPTQDTFLNAIELVRDPSHVRDHRISEWRALLEQAGFGAETLDSWLLDLDFEGWVERIGAPAASVVQLRALFDGAPREVRQAFAIGAPGPTTCRSRWPSCAGSRGGPERRPGCFSGRQDARPRPRNPDLPVPWECRSSRTRAAPASTAFPRQECHSCTDPFRGSSPWSRCSRSRVAP